MKPNTSELSLPQGYKKLFDINLQKNKKLALTINLAALAIAALMVVPALFFGPVFRLGLGQCAVLLIGMLLYIVLHELVHGLFIKRYTSAKVRYGFTGAYAFAGADAYFYKKPYLIIALAPVIVWGLVLLGLNLALGAAWFWPVYLIQITNISGAVGDFYVTVKLCRMADSILVRDSGVSMKVYGQ
ncbi:MAG: DUF3267 domain-containing protein [Clostridia bacterium]|nr:DUF3267 domain-containing protein [Clostridia bacterium]